MFETQTNTDQVAISSQQDPTLEAYMYDHVCVKVLNDLYCCICKSTMSYYIYKLNRSIVDISTYCQSYC